MTIAGRGNYPMHFSTLTASDVVNLGHGGVSASPKNICKQTAGPYAGTDEFAEALQWNADIFVVMLGTNDVSFCWQPDVFVAQMELVSRALLRVSGNVKLALVVPPPLAAQASLDQVLRSELAPRIVSLAERLQQELHSPLPRVISIDLRPAFEHHCLKGSCVKAANITAYRACFCLGAQLVARTVLDALQRQQWIHVPARTKHSNSRALNVWSSNPLAIAKRDRRLQTTWHANSRSELITAVDLWVADRSAALTSYGHISAWDVSRLTDLTGIFCASSHHTSVTRLGCRPSVAGFNDDLSEWETGAATKMDALFAYQSTFNNPLQNWDVSAVQSMESIFAYCTAFNQPLASWDISNVQTIGSAF
jgi:hypothetical protein